MLEKLRKELKRLEIIVENIKNHIEVEQDKLIQEMFVKLNSPLERMPLLKELSNRIMQLKGVSFRTTENSIVYQVNDQNFMAVYPQVNALRIEYAIPDGWSNCKITDDTEIDGVIVLIEESCDLIREKKK
ncbi:hypothetical protein ES705_28199 [subsurface metagenome]